MNALDIANFLFAQRETRKILLVEDEICDAILAKRALSSLNCEIIHAMSGEEALELNGHFALVLVDLKLPGMDGVEVAKELRNRGNCVAVLSGSSFGDYVNRALCEGFVILPKPLSLKMFSDVVWGLGMSERHQICTA